MTDHMPSKTIWDSHRGRITSRVGGWRRGEEVFIRGRRLFDELLGQVSYMQLTILNATGRLVSRAIADWFEASAMCVSWPDSRIWCNQVGAFAGTVRTDVAAATMMGMLAADSRMYAGGRNYLVGIPFIRQALRDRQRGDSLEDIVSRCRFAEGRPLIMGFVRPVSTPDERVGPMIRLTAALGLALGPHRALAMDLSAYLTERYGEGINVGGFNCAVLADEGFTGEEAFRIRCTCNASGVTASYCDTRDQPPETYLPLRCDDIHYAPKAQGDADE